MPTKKTSAPLEIFQIKVNLLNASPPIWRRLLVPASLTLEQLHHVLQVAMGWEDCHMHEFSMGRRLFGAREFDEPSMGGPAVEDESTVPLSSLLGRVGAKMRGIAVASMPNNQNLRGWGGAKRAAMRRNSVCSRWRRCSGFVIVKHAPIAAYTLL